LYTQQWSTHRLLRKRLIWMRAQGSSWKEHDPSQPCEQGEDDLWQLLGQVQGHWQCGQGFVEQVLPRDW
jgi:hypothetical protein